MKRYKLIEYLTRLYFGQDYEYFGETGAEVMAEYRKASTPAELEALVATLPGMLALTGGTPPATRSPDPAPEEAARG